MSETMTPLPFQTLMRWLAAEYARNGSVFGVRRLYTGGEKSLPIFGGEAIETPFGPAAGPHTQLAQNIIAAYAGGARFFELKTVQKIDGSELSACINRPCIQAEDECYNCEWSTELTVPQALEEYVKAWFACHVLAKQYGLGQPNGFVFHMSVGYDLEGIRGEKINRYITDMTDASATAIFQECRRVLLSMFPQDADFIRSIPARISRSVTISTLHGCPPEEIGSIASYLIREKKLHTFVKCNPTLLGYDSARDILDGLGYDYIAFGRKHFDGDLQYADAVPMFRRLHALAKENGVEFGLKLSNTFPVDVTAGELPCEEMYMAGKSLFPLTIEMARRLSADLDGTVRISFSGGADYFNIDKLFACGIWPVTMATTLLKPGGYQRFTQIAEKLETMPYTPFIRVDVKKVSALATAARQDARYKKALKPLPRRKNYHKVPLLDCFTAPCKGGCPIGQDIPEYLELCRQGRYGAALEVILEKNPLPFITGTLCAHHCMEKCTRNYYERPVQIRDAKLTAARRGYDEVIAALKTPAPVYNGKMAAVIGGGPAGMAAAYFCAREGIPTTLFEKENALGGTVRHVIPSFRIANETIEKDVSFLQKMGVDVKLGTPAPDISTLKRQGYTHIFFATGASLPGQLDIPGRVLPAIGWMKAAKAGTPEPLGHVAVVGGGNTAMDAARLALRLGAASSTIVYRRTKKYMPAEEDELEMALAEGVQFLELATPLAQKDGKLICRKMALGAPDTSGRRSPIETEEMLEIPCDTVIAAVGEQVDGGVFTACGVDVNHQGRPKFATNLPGVYVGGDALRGPATIVEAIADGCAFAEEAAGYPISAAVPPVSHMADCLPRKGVLCDSAKREGDRCLNCNTVCENCVDVCPNRANVEIRLPDGRREILHIDQLCNECGNCAVFCPYDSAPYREKMTLFHTRAGFDASPDTTGFLPLGGKKILLRLESRIFETDLSEPNDLPPEVEGFLYAALANCEP